MTRTLMMAMLLASLSARADDKRKTALVGGDRGTVVVWPKDDKAICQGVVTVKLNDLSGKSAPPASMTAAQRVSDFLIQAGHSVASFQLPDGCDALLQVGNNVSTPAVPAWTPVQRALQPIVVDAPEDSKLVVTAWPRRPAAQQWSRPTTWFVVLDVAKNGAVRAEGTLAEGARQSLDLARGRWIVLAISPSAQTVTAQLANAIVTDATPRRVSISLSRPPPSRVRASLDANDGSHLDVEWDPAQPTGLTRKVTLTPKTTWRISLWSEPVLVTPADATHSQYIVLSFSTPFAFSDASGRVRGRAVGRFFDALNADTKLSAEALPPVEVTVEEDEALPDLAESKLTVATKLGAPSGRSLSDTVPQGVSELLQIFAEIAFERAKSAAFGVLKDRLVQFVCEDLRLPANATTHLWTVVEGARSSDASPSDSDLDPRPRILPRTCDVVTNFRIQDIATSAKQLFQALLADLTTFGLKVVGDEVTALLAREKELVPWAHLLQPVLRQLAPMIYDIASGHTDVLARDGQLLLVSLGNQNWQKILDDLTADELSAFAGADRDAPRYIACGVELTFAILGECHAAGSCDARDVLEMIRHAKQHFKEPYSDIHCFPDESIIDDKNVLTYWPDLPQLVNRALDVIVPPKGATPHTTLRAAINLLFDIVDRVASNSLRSRVRSRLPDSDWTTLLGAIDAAKNAGCSTACDDLGSAANAAHSAQERYHASPPDLEGAWQAFSDVSSWIVAAGKDLDQPTQPELKALVMLQQARDKAFNDLKAARDNAGSLLLLRDVLGDLRKLANAVLDQDAQLALSSAASLLKRVIVAIAGKQVDCAAVTDTARQRTCYRRAAAIDKLTALVGAVASYASTYLSDAKGDQAAIKQQHDARKKAVESLIDASTKRDNRGGDWIWSIGANVGLSVGQQWLALNSYSAEWESYPQLELPMGFAVQYLPNGANKSIHPFWRYLGVHFQMSVIDLAQFISYRSKDNSVSTNITWADFLMVGAQIGVLIGKPQTPVVLGVEGRWSPTLWTGKPTVNGVEQAQNVGGAFRVGIFFAYYVPFFDFN